MQLGGHLEGGHAKIGHAWCLAGRPMPPHQPWALTRTRTQNRSTGSRCASEFRSAGSFAAVRPGVRNSTHRAARKQFIGSKGGNVGMDREVGEDLVLAVIIRYTLG